jgi:hypothetical protein
VVTDLAVKKGDRFRAMGTDVEVLRASKTWADIRVQRGEETWTKRQPLPFPKNWRRRPPNLETHEFDPDWCLHPGVHWRELVEYSGLSQVEIAKQMGDEDLWDTRLPLQYWLLVPWWRFRAWLRHCPVCGRRGYSPDLPAWEDDKIAQVIGGVNVGRCRCCGGELEIP